MRGQPIRRAVTGRVGRAEPAHPLLQRAPVLCQVSDFGGTWWIRVQFVAQLRRRRLRGREGRGGILDAPIDHRERSRAGERARSLVEIAVDLRHCVGATERRRLALQPRMEFATRPRRRARRLLHVALAA